MQHISNGQSQAEAQSEELLLAEFESATRSLLRLSAAGFLTKYRRGEFSQAETDPKILAVAEMIPAGLRR